MRRRIQILVFSAGLWAINVAVAHQDEGSPSIVRPPEGSIADPMVAEMVQERIDAAAAQPDDADLRKQLGMVYAANNLHDLARRSFDHAIALGEVSARVHYYNAMSLWTLHKHGDAFAAIEKARNADGAYAPVHWRQGSWFLESGQLDDAESCFRRSIECENGHAAGQVGLAQVHLFRRQYQDAANILNAMISDGATHPYVYHLLANAYRGLRQLNEARAALAVSSGMRPGFPDPWLDEVNQLESGYQATLTRSQTLLNQGNIDAAVALVEEVRNRFPLDPTILNYEYYIHSARGDSERAMQTLLAALEIDPAHVPSLLNASLEMEQQEQLEPAIEYADRAIAVQPKSGPALLQRARIALLQGDNSTGEDYLGRAVRCGIQQANHRTMYGQVLSSQGKWQEAVEVFQQVVHNDPGFATAWVWLGRAFLEVGEIDAAGIALRRATELNPNENLLRETMARWRSADQSRGDN